MDGILIRKDLLDKSGYFNEHLRLHQDSTLIIQMAECGTLIPGRLDTPVAMRGVHESNRILNDENLVESKCLARKTLFYWGYKKKLKRKKLIALFYNYLIYLFMSSNSKDNLKPLNIVQVKAFLYELLNHPILSVGAISEHFSRKPIYLNKSQND